MEIDSTPFTLDPDILAPATSIDIFACDDEPMESIEMEKKMNRAKRFGLPEEESTDVAFPPISEEDLTRLYNSFTASECKAKHPKLQLRLEAIHVRGVDNMSTDDVMAHFSKFKPIKIEWVNDYACNVVWKTANSAATAMLEMSKSIDNDVITNAEENKMAAQADKKSADTLPPKPDIITSAENSLAQATSKQPADLDIVMLESDNEESGDEEGEIDTDERKEERGRTARLSRALGIAVPPGVWRLGVAVPAGVKALLFRFAKVEDKKMQGAQKHSIYYQKHGNPHFSGFKGIISSTMKGRRSAKRTEFPVKGGRPKRQRSPETRGDEIDRKVNRQMRMYADDEEEKLKRRKLQNLPGSTMNRSDLRSVLNRRRRSLSPSHKSSRSGSPDDLRRLLRRTDKQDRGGGRTDPAFVDLRTKLNKTQVPHRTEKNAVNVIEKLTVYVGEGDKSESGDESDTSDS